VRRPTSTSCRASGTAASVGGASGSPGRTSGTSSRRRSLRARFSTAWGPWKGFRTDYAGGFVGVTFRFFDPASRQWSIYWADTRYPALLLAPPVIGSFSGDVGVFECDDTFEGRPIRVRYTWSDVTTPTPHWEQAFSDDGGETWETNWVAEFTRAGKQMSAAV
jgi:hypothetical protein